jgi:hypothetical protein
LGNNIGYVAAKKYLSTPPAFLDVFSKATGFLSFKLLLRNDEEV